MYISHKCQMTLFLLNVLHLSPLQRQGCLLTKFHQIQRHPEVKDSFVEPQTQNNVKNIHLFICETCLFSRPLEKDALSPDPSSFQTFCLWHVMFINARSILQDGDTSSEQQRCPGEENKSISGSFWSTLASVGARLHLTPRGFDTMITLLHGPSTYLTLSFRKVFQKRFMKTPEWSLGGGGLARRHFFIFWRDFLRFLRDGGCPPGRLRRGLGEDWGGGGALNDHLLWRPTLCLMETDVGRVRQGPASQEV